MGVDYVIVNGQLEYDQGKLTGLTAGRAVRGQGISPSATGSFPENLLFH
jgi:hypothetical protein